MLNRVLREGLADSHRAVVLAEVLEMYTDDSRHPAPFSLVTVAVLQVCKLFRLNALDTAS